MKLKQVAILGLLAFTLLSCSESVDTNWPEMTTEAKPWTRWWWMGSAVDKSNLTYNLEEMSKAGIGGVEITPIYGVKGQEDKYIEHLSPQWMEMLQHTESEAKRLGMKVDLSMGTGWPFGGPEVNIEHAASKAIFQEYRLKGGSKLTQKIVVNDKKQKDVAKIIKLMAYALSSDEVVDVTDQVSEDGVLNWTAPKNSEWKLVALFLGKTFQKVKRAAPGGQGYVMDHLNPEAVQAYFNKFETAFTQNNIGYPNSFFNDSYEVYGGDWTPTLLDEFEKMRGYKLQNHFQDLMLKGETEQSARVIADYRETLGDLLKKNFTSAWVAWAHKKNVSIRNQAHGSPANLIDIYASVDIPECETFGITDFDIPGLRKDTIRKENDGDPTTLKYASSAAHIAGKKYTSAETFTWLTEHFRTSLSQCKPEIDQMFIAGVNHVYFHGATYSPKEAAWPGWKFYASIDMSPTNSIWRDAPAFFDYIARCQSFLQYGEPDSDFLLYLPIYDMWKEQGERNMMTFAIHGMRERLPDFYNTVEQIRKRAYDVDYISDAFIASTIVTNKGLLQTQGGVAYKALILPAVKSIPFATLEKIYKLAEAGATIIFVENYPTEVPGFNKWEKRSKDLNELVSLFPEASSFEKAEINKIGKGKVLTVKNYEDLFASLSIASEPVKSEFGGEYIRRKHEKGYHYFMAMLQNKTIDGWIPLAIEAESALIFDPMTGEKGLAKVRQADGKTEVYLQMKPGESLILKTFDKENVSAESWIYKVETEKEIDLNKDWELSFVESYPAVSESFAIDTLGSWTVLPNDVLNKNMGTARYKTSFVLDAKSETDYLVNLGDVRESARLYVNGEYVSTLFAVPFEANIGKYLKEGENTLEVEVTNLPANRIADYDRTGVEWRIFHDANIVSLNYEKVDFGVWGVMPSGLLGPVKITELKEIDL